MFTPALSAILLALPLSLPFFVISSLHGIGRLWISTSLIPGPPATCFISTGMSTQAAGVAPKDVEAAAEILRANDLRGWQAWVGRIPREQVVAELGKLRSRLDKRLVAVLDRERLFETCALQLAANGIENLSALGKSSQARVERRRAEK